MPRNPSRRGVGFVVGWGACLLLVPSGVVRGQPPEPVGPHGPARIYPLDLSTLR